jgi:hypothetical protein
VLDDEAVRHTPGDVRGWRKPGTRSQLR